MNLSFSSRVVSAHNAMTLMYSDDDTDKMSMKLRCFQHTKKRT